MITALSGNKTKILFAVFLVATVIMPLSSKAFSTEELGDKSVVGDFVVGPGKQEVFMNPGETKVVEMKITNRTGEIQKFEMDVEDIAGSRDLRDTVKLLGNERGPYSLRDYMTIEQPKFTLEHAERARVFVTISVPFDAEPGGLYGSVLTKITSKPAGEGTGAAGAAIVSRIGTLFFVRVAGEVAEDGLLKEFSIGPDDKKFLAGGPVNFHILFENNGSVHLNPYGLITIKNVTGETVGEREVEPWFVLPDSLRLRELGWDRPLLIGRYTATAQINRGYDDIIDESTISFWILPWKLILLVIVILVVLVLLIYFVMSKFEIRKKNSPPENS